MSRVFSLSLSLSPLPKPVTYPLFTLVFTKKPEFFLLSGRYSAFKIISCVAFSPRGFPTTAHGRWDTQVVPRAGRNYRRDGRRISRSYTLADAKVDWRSVRCCGGSCMPPTFYAHGILIILVGGNLCLQVARWGLLAFNKPLRVSYLEARVSLEAYFDAISF